MKLRGCVDEDFSNYKEPSMFLIFPHCNFKCCVEAGNNICQNMDVVKEPIVEIETKALIERYMSNPITKAIVCGGLEPFDSYDDLRDLISTLRWDYSCLDPVVIYTGYDAGEIIEEVFSLSKYANVIVKFGRFIPDKPSHYDELLGVDLASPNQYAAMI